MHNICLSSLSIIIYTYINTYNRQSNIYIYIYIYIHTHTLNGNSVKVKSLSLRNWCCVDNKSCDFRLSHLSTHFFHLTILSIVCVVNFVCWLKITKPDNVSWRIKQMGDWNLLSLTLSTKTHICFIMRSKHVCQNTIFPSILKVKQIRYPCLNNKRLHLPQKSHKHPDKLSPTGLWSSTAIYLSTQPKQGSECFLKG